LREPPHVAALDTTTTAEDNRTAMGRRGVRSQWRTLTNLLKILALALVALAVCQELSKSPEQRTWHGRIAGLIPYDFRLPTAARIRDRLWNPDDPRVLTERVFGVGWTINFHSLLLKSRTLMKERNLTIPEETRER